jgi:hypothetical protein
MAAIGILLHAPLLPAEANYKFYNGQERMAVNGTHARAP